MGCECTKITYLELAKIFLELFVAKSRVFFNELVIFIAERQSSWFTFAFPHLTNFHMKSFQLPA